MDIDWTIKLVRYHILFYNILEHQKWGGAHCAGRNVWMIRDISQTCRPRNNVNINVIPKIRG